MLDNKALLRRLGVAMMIFFVFPTYMCSTRSMTPEEANRILNLFYLDNVPEPINDRHIVDAGRAIVPYLTKEVQRRDMPKRGYAILALGKIGDRRALPVLIQILEDRTELIYFREDALRAIWHIDRQLGEKFAEMLGEENPDSIDIIKLLRNGQI
ncbi:MAG: hypothetical protein A4E72_00096 [Syntrophus sp. PtaU1.Bin208]|nr:MAG: hypothetical protein A4E72_00096 [Syntrophus sp. PtaU1.Bin208]